MNCKYCGKELKRRPGEQSYASKQRVFCNSSCSSRHNIQTKPLPLIIKHGHGRVGKETGTWWSWKDMVKRCTNPNRREWKYYGGRGISVCERWRTFENFLADMGQRLEGQTLDRYPNRDGNYEPGNCRWATRKEQRLNQRPRASSKPPRLPSDKVLRCKDCGKRAKTYYDKEMKAVDGCGFVTDCGTGGCGFSAGLTYVESRANFRSYRHQEVAL